MDQKDREALEQAMAMARLESDGRSAQLDAKLKHEPWEDVAAFAASCCQSATLGLHPWQDPVCDIDLDDVRDDDREGAELLRKMLAAGISRYEPDPMRALERAEKAGSRIG
jgi:hypothetical protein